MRVKKRNASLSFSHQAYDLIRSGILKGQFPMGAPLSRRQLASQLGTSRLPVSEALQRLESEGIVESRPRVGTRVRVPTRQDIRGHYVIREALETQSARLFREGQFTATRGAAPHGRKTGPTVRQSSWEPV